MNAEDPPRATLDGPVDRVDVALQGLPRAIEPPRDLWPAIAARLTANDGRRTPRRYSWLLPAVAATVLVAASSLVTASLLGYRQENANIAARTAPASPTTNVAAGATASVTPAAFGPGYTLDKEYVAARSQLASTLQARIERMPPSARQKLEANLAELHRAANEINAALAQQPGDPLLEELLLSTYQDELAVLANVNQLTSYPGNGAGPKADAKRMEL
jgi:hypothetical protein